MEIDEEDCPFPVGTGQNSRDVELCVDPRWRAVFTELQSDDPWPVLIYLT